MFPFMFAGAERERGFDALVRPVALIKKPFRFPYGCFERQCWGREGMMKCP